MIFLLNNDPSGLFPNVELSEKEPNGLLAVGGDMSSQRLLTAYRQGIFPWYSKGEPILWWSPNPRLILSPNKIKVSRSLRKTLRKGLFEVTYDRAFEGVIHACAAPRRDSSETWLIPDMIRAYTQLHDQGYAHSVEVWLAGRLVGGLYGVALGQVFFGESMFSLVSDSSKVALVKLGENLVSWGYQLIDCQVYTPHLISMGAEEISRKQFCLELDTLCHLQVAPSSWGKP